VKISQKNCCLVVTTVSDGCFLKSYANQILSENLQDNCKLIVISDKKTPNSIFQISTELKKRGIKIICPNIREQDEFLKNLDGTLADIIPYNSDNRRNIGYLIALKEHVDCLISIDDDNLPYGDIEFISEHIHNVGESGTFERITTSTGWFNPIELLNVEPITFFPRGFPYSKKNKPYSLKVDNNESTIHANVGLWLNAPDVDAITWLALSPKVQSFKGHSIILDKSTWAPINSQNTCISYEAIPAFYFIPMGVDFNGLIMDRAGDIFAGYFLRACMDNLGYSVRYGSPTLMHERNSHNYLLDVKNELPAIWLIEEIIPALKEARLSGKTYEETYLSLASWLMEVSSKIMIPHYGKALQKFLMYIAKCMNTWINTVKLIS